MKLNNKGFTLLELLVTIILLSVVMAITSAAVVNTIEKSKEKNREILIKNIKIGAQNFFEECDNKDVIPTKINCDGTIIKEDDWEKLTDGFSGKHGKAIISLGTLLDNGFLKGKTNSDGIKVVTNPLNEDEVLNNCKIKITKIVDKDNNNVKYTVTASDMYISNDDVYWTPKNKPQIKINGCPKDLELNTQRIYKFGDVDRNEVFDIDDWKFISKCAVGKCDECQILIADTDGDRKISLIDGRRFLQALQGNKLDNRDITCND